MNDLSSTVPLCFKWIPKKALRKSLILGVLWMCLCYAFVRFIGNEEVFLSDSGISTGRLLLQQKHDALYNRPSTTEFNFLQADPLVDRSSLSDNEIASIVGKKTPNFPVAFWQKNKNKVLAFNKTCAKFPQYHDVSFNNIYWQSMKTSNGSFYLYAAYYDNRTLAMAKPVVRILGMIDRLKPTVKTFCQLWFDGKKQPVFAKVFEYKYIWVKGWGNYKNGLLQPYLISCQIPHDLNGRVPESVSLVEKVCQTSTTNLKIIYNHAEDGQKQDFAVCVKGLDFFHQDLSVRLVEWLELLFILGAGKVVIYDLEVHPNITKVLQHYERLGKVEVTTITLPGEQPNIPGLIHMYLKSKQTNKRQNELIPYNDCLYKNMYKYKFILLLDTDEVIIPKEVENWKLLMNTIIPKALAQKSTPRASYNARNVYFMDSMLTDDKYSDDIPHFMHMLQHVYRSANYTKPGHYVKCFHNTERVLTLHNHYPLSCLGGSCSSYSIETSDAQLHHYRSGCVSGLKKTCHSVYMNHTVKDTSIWRYKEQLTSRVVSTLTSLGFFGRSTETTVSESRV